MVWGRYVFNNARDEAFQCNLAEFSDRVGTVLPNGGIAFYYPNVYPLNRMRSPSIMYSAIAQAEVLSGYMKAAQANPSLLPLAQRVEKSMTFKWLEGDTNLAGVAQSVEDQQTKTLSSRHCLISGERFRRNPRYGYPTLHHMLRAEGLVQNPRHTYRIYREEGLPASYAVQGSSSSDPHTSQNLVERFINYYIKRYRIIVYCQAEDILDSTD